MQHSGPSDPRPSLSTFEYEIWRDLIHRRSGLYFPESRIRFLCQCLWDRMKRQRYASYSDYYHYVAFHPEAAAEWGALYDLLLNHETSFFRNAPSFDALRSHVLPELSRQRLLEGSSSLDLWSAGCSSGEETYSIAMEVLEAFNPRLWQISVCGTDVSEPTLKKARQAVYRLRKARPIPEAYLRKYTVLLDEEGSDATFRIADAVRSVVRFAQLDLNETQGYAIGPQDVIFCQNVLIYFQPEQRLAVVERLAKRLKPGGYLLLGPTELVGLRPASLRSLHVEGCLVYHKTSRD